MKAIILAIFAILGIVKAGHDCRMCPASPDVCVPYYNECCSDIDCYPNKICCITNCGNRCSYPVSRPPYGVRKPCPDPNCQVESYDDE